MLGILLSGLSLRKPKAWYEKIWCWQKLGTA